MNSFFSCAEEKDEVNGSEGEEQNSIGKMARGKNGKAESFSEQRGCKCSVGNTNLCIPICKY